VAVNLRCTYYFLKTISITLQRPSLINFHRFKHAKLSAHTPLAWEKQCAPIRRLMVWKADCSKAVYPALWMWSYCKVVYNLPSKPLQRCRLLNRKRVLLVLMHTTRNAMQVDAGDLLLGFPHGPSMPSLDRPLVSPMARSASLLLVFVSNTVTSRCSSVSVHLSEMNLENCWNKSRVC
jgi:hypothetical protein